MRNVILENLWHIASPFYYQRIQEVWLVLHKPSPLETNHLYRWAVKSIFDPLYVIWIRRWAIKLTAE